MAARHGTAVHTLAGGMPTPGKARSRAGRVILCGVPGPAPRVPLNRRGGFRRRGCTQVATTVHNIIVGKLWVDQHGTMDIVNHTTKEVCKMTYVPYSYFSSAEVSLPLPWRWRWLAVAP